MAGVVVVGGWMVGRGDVWWRWGIRDVDGDAGTRRDLRSSLLVRVHVVLKALGSFVLFVALGTAIDLLRAVWIGVGHAMMIAHPVHIFVLLPAAGLRADEWSRLLHSGGGAVRVALAALTMAQLAGVVGGVLLFRMKILMREGSWLCMERSG